MPTAKEYFAAVLSESGGSVQDSPGVEQEQPLPLKPWVIYDELKKLEPMIGQGQTLKEARIMIDQGYTLDQILSCANALLSDEWRRKKGIPLNASAITRGIRAHIEATGSKWTPL